jgi:hypothetical protein
MCSYPLRTGMAEIPPRAAGTPPSRCPPLALPRLGSCCIKLLLKCALISPSLFERLAVASFLVGLVSWIKQGLDKRIGPRDSRFRSTSPGRVCRTCGSGRNRLNRYVARGWFGWFGLGSRCFLRFGGLRSDEFASSFCVFQGNFL